MIMLIVEDGTGVADADSFISLANARVLAAKYALTIAEDDASAMASLRNAYNYLSKYEMQLQGTRTFERQTGIFPRTGVILNGYYLSQGEIHSQVKMAQMYAAASIADGFNVNAGAAASSEGGTLASFSVDGVYSETYQSGTSSSQPSSGDIEGVSRCLMPFTVAASVSIRGVNRLYREAF